MFGAVNVGQAQWERKPEGSDSKNAYIGNMLLLDKPGNRGSWMGQRQPVNMVIDSQSF